jgi:hypothetical protein
MSASARLRSAVYTVLLGGYESLNDAQNVGDGTVDFLCFTDDGHLSSKVWDIRLVAPLFPRDLQRSQREIKVRGHTDLEPYERSLYIDNSVSLTQPPEGILDVWLAKHDLAIPLHSWRPRVLDEFLAVIELGLDEPARVYEQLYHYSENRADVLEQVPMWNAIIARNNTDTVQVTMRRWFDEILRYSRRDQLSANMVLGDSPVNLNRVQLDNFSSPIHEWPVPVNRLPMTTRKEQGRIVPDLARIRELESLWTQEKETSELREQRIVELSALIKDIRSTRSWAIADRLSKVAATLRMSRDTPTKKRQS